MGPVPVSAVILASLRAVAFDYGPEVLKDPETAAGLAEEEGFKRAASWVREDPERYRRGLLLGWRVESRRR
jgi:hypothetical protein